MKFFLKAGFASLLLTTGSVYALDPVQGIYAGIFLGGSKARSVDVTAIVSGLKAPIGTLKYSFLGDIGGQVGYRMDQFRVEGALSYNNNPYDTLTIGGETISKQGNSHANNMGIRQKGQTGIAALMLNGYYDNYALFDQTCFVPYIGFGIGYANVQNKIQFFYNNTAITGADFSMRDNAFAGQAIIGTNYFLDDFTAFGLDFRYFSTAGISSHFGNTALTDSVRAQYMAINLSFNGSFDAG